MMLRLTNTPRFTIFATKEWIDTNGGYRGKQILQNPCQARTCKLNSWLRIDFENFDLERICG